MASTSGAVPAKRRRGRPPKSAQVPAPTPAPDLEQGRQTGIFPLYIADLCEELERQDDLFLRSGPKDYLYNGGNLAINYVAGKHHMVLATEMTLGRITFDPATNEFTRLPTEEVFDGPVYQASIANQNGRLLYGVRQQHHIKLAIASADVFASSNSPVLSPWLQTRSDLVNFHIGPDARTVGVINSAGWICVGSIQDEPSKRQHFKVTGGTSADSQQSPAYLQLVSSSHLMLLACNQLHLFDLRSSRDPVQTWFCPNDESAVVFTAGSDDTKYTVVTDASCTIFDARQATATMQRHHLLRSLPILVGETGLGKESHLVVSCRKGETVALPPDPVKQPHVLPKRTAKTITAVVAASHADKRELVFRALENETVQAIDVTAKAIISEVEPMSKPRPVLIYTDLQCYAPNIRIRKKREAGRPSKPIPVINQLKGKSDQLKDVSKLAKALLEAWGDYQ